MHHDPGWRIGEIQSPAALVQKQAPAKVAHNGLQLANLSTHFEQT